MKDKWIQEAELKEGAFTRWAKTHGYSVENGIPKEAILAGKRSADERVQKMARLAETFQRIANRNKER